MSRLPITTWIVLPARVGFQMAPRVYTGKLFKEPHAKRDAFRRDCGARDGRGLLDKNETRYRSLALACSPNRLAHRRLDEQRLDVLPVLLEQRDQKVDAHHDVGQELVLAHLHVAHSDTQAEDLFELELDGGTEFLDFLVDVVRVGDGGGELAGLGETGTEKTGDLLDESLGSEESIVLFGHLFDELLVLVHLLQVIHRQEVEAEFLGFIAVLGVAEDADGELGAGDGGEADGARETLVTLGVVVLETDLELDGLGELAGLFGGALEELAGRLSDSRDADFLYERTSKRANERSEVARLRCPVVSSKSRDISGVCAFRSISVPVCPSSSR